MPDGRGGYGDVLVASVTFAGVYFLVRWMRPNAAKDAGKRYPPSLPLLPFCGSVLREGMSVLPEHFKKASETLGPVVSFKIGTRLVVVLNGYKTIVGALVKQSETFADRGYQFIEGELINRERRGIIFARYNDVFKRYHKMSLSILREFGFGVNRVMETRILQEVESLHEEILNLNGRPFDPKWPVTFSTANVVLSIAFGKNFQQTLPKDHSKVVESVIECVSHMDLVLNMVPIVRYLPTYSQKVTGLRTSSERLLKAIEVGIDFVKTTDSDPSYIKRFLEIHGANYDHQDLVFLVRDLAFAGTETVSTTVQWSMVELANHPEIMKRFQKELDEMVPGDRFPSIDDKPRLPYTEAVILEVMRRHTVVPFLVPHAPTKDTELNGYVIPEGCMVLPNVYSAHMDETFWKDPEDFRPERFLDADNKIVHGDKMIGFGLGKRSCLGEILGRHSVFLFIASLVQRFDFLPPEGQDSIVATEVVAITTLPSHFEVRVIPRVKPTQG